MTRNFALRGVEIHSRSMWYHSHMERALDFMEEYGFNALILHQSDLLNQLVLPRRYLSNDVMWERFRGMRTFAIENNRVYLNRYIRDAQRRGIGFYFSVKVIHCPDEILELFPYLVREGNIVCPTDPFWPEYLEACIEDLCVTVPDFRGLILSAGTHEARTSLTKKNPCRCDRCRNIDPGEWYRAIFQAINRVLKRYDKQFVVRDFSNTASGQSILLQAARQVDRNVIISLKYTPHDYFPTFPDNPKIGTTGQEEWVELDAWGQFYGAGIFPASMVEDFQERLNRFYGKGVTGAYFRTDWEGMYENSAFSSSNLLNLCAGGMLSSNLDTDPDDIYRSWAAKGWFHTFQCDSHAPSPKVPAAPDAWMKMRDFMKASWSVLKKTVYVRTHWFCEDNMFPDSLSIAFRMMISYHGRDQWEPGASQMVAVNRDNLNLIFHEKNEALWECGLLSQILQVETLGFDADTVADTREMLNLYRLYCGIGWHSCRVVFLTQLALDRGCCQDHADAEAAVRELLSFREKVVNHLDQRRDGYPHIVYWLLNENRMRLLAQDAVRLLEKQESGGKKHG